MESDRKVTWVSSYYVTAPNGDMYPFVVRFNDGVCMRICCKKSDVFGLSCKCKGRHYAFETIRPDHMDYDWVVQEAIVGVYGFRVLLDREYPYVPAPFAMVYRNGSLTTLSQEDIDALYNAPQRKKYQY